MHGATGVTAKSRLPSRCRPARDRLMTDQPPVPRHPPLQTRSSSGGTPQAPLNSDLGPRLASALVLVVLAFATLWAGGQVYVLFWLVACFIVLGEWQRILAGPVYLVRLFAGSATLAMCAAMAAGGLGDLAFGVLAAGAVATALFIALGTGNRGLAIWAGAGIFYAGALLISVLVLRLSLRHGVISVLWLFAIVWGTDILAYFSGRTIGGPKLWPRVSP
ncbi:MAG: phosphatidate cytidylyltransferase, partial [Beijerinckiaceae bacterium]|nr:phosphatidate cytidylyltransferase [Beijerinckiaceae bacterium]